MRRVLKLKSNLLIVFFVCFEDNLLVSLQCEIRRPGYVYNKGLKAMNRLLG